MSEYAYSKELDEEVSANQAHEYSLSGELTDRSAFQCADNKCSVPLTLTNFGKSKRKGAKQIGFRISSHVQKHSSALLYISKDLIGVITKFLIRVVNYNF